MIHLLLISQVVLITSVYLHIHTSGNCQETMLYNKATTRQGEVRPFPAYCKYLQ